MAQPPVIPSGPPTNQPPAQPQYPLPQQPYYGQPPAPKKKGLPGWAIALIVVGAVVVLVCGGLAALFGIGLGAKATEPKPTVRITSCEYDGLMATYAKYTIKNNDTKAHDYYVSGTIGHSPALPDILKNVAPGETASGEMMGTGQGDCHITSVDQQ